MTAYVSRVNRFAMLDIHGNGPATESALGGVYADPTGRNRRTEDGHYAWAVEGHLAVARAGVAWDGKGPVPVLGLPEWGDYPAPRTGVANGWEQVQRLQDAFPDRRIRPFTPFFQAVVDPLYSIGVVPVTLDVDLPPGRRLEADWRDQRTGKRLRLTTGRPPAPGMVRVRTYREVLELWRLPDDPTTTPVEVVDHVLQPGLRAPIPVRSRTALFELTGKEGDDLLTQMVDPGAIKNGELTIYRHANTWEPVLERAKTLGATELARRTGLSERTARYVIQGRRPSPQTAALVSSALSGTEDPPPRVCGRAGCDARVSSRKRFCSDRCRRAAARARDRLMLHEVGAVRCRCGAIRYGSAKDPCPSCGGSGYVEVRARQCPGCGAQRVGDTTATCPACGRASA